MRLQGIGENTGTGERSAADILEKEVQQTYLSGIGEDTMDSGDNPVMTKMYSGAS